MAIPEEHRARMIEEWARRKVYLADPRAWDYINVPAAVVDYYERAIVEPPTGPLVDAALRVFEKCESQEQKIVISALLYRQGHAIGREEFVRMVKERTNTAKLAALSLALAQDEAARHEVLKYFADFPGDEELSKAIALWKHKNCRTAIESLSAKYPASLNLLIAASTVGVDKEVELTFLFNKTKILSEKIVCACALSCSSPKADEYVDFLIQTLNTELLLISDRLLVIQGLSKANTRRSVGALLELVDERLHGDRNQWKQAEVDDDHEAVVILLSLDEGYDRQRIELGTALVERLLKLRANSGLVLQAAYAAQIRNKIPISRMGPRFAGWFATISKAPPVAPSLLPLQSDVANLHRINFLDPKLDPFNENH